MAGPLRVVSANVWGVGGALPLMTPIRSAEAVLARCNAGANVVHSVPLVVCVQEAWTCQISVLAHLLATYTLRGVYTGTSSHN